MSRASSPLRGLLIGLDGADWDLLTPWLEAGVLPNLARLRDHSVRAGMTAPYPINSIASWTTLATGVSPALHGLYGFLRHAQGDYARTPVCPGDVPVPTLWDILGKHGVRTGVINWPNTYPPRPVQGFMVSGILVAHNDAFAYPPALEHDLRAHCGRYVVDATWQEVNRGDMYPDDFLDKLFYMAKKREEALHYACAHYPCDVLATIFTGTDRVMHSFWRFMDPNHPQYTPEAGDKWGTAIRDYYVLLDTIIGGVLERWTDDDSLVFVVSDHGFGPVYHELNIVRWLMDQGWLTLKPHGADGAAIEDVIDWTHTRVYPGTVSESSLRVNLHGREPDGIVQPGTEYDELLRAVTERLTALRDPDSGVPLAAQVLSRTDLWGADAPNAAPDLVVVPAEKYEVADDWKTSELINPTPVGTGGHRRTGLWMAAGPLFHQQRDVADIDAASILPTALAALDVPIPRHVEGQVRSDMFAAAPTVRYDDDASAPLDAGRNTDDDTEMVKARLRGLGYL